MIDPAMAPLENTSCPASSNMPLTSYWKAAGRKKRDAFGDTVIDTLSEYFPNLKNIILHRQVLTPQGYRGHGRFKPKAIFSRESSAYGNCFSCVLHPGMPIMPHPLKTITSAVRGRTREGGSPALRAGWRRSKS
jgi:hypothetical protein